MDLSMNVEQHKKYLRRDINEKHEKRGESGNSPESSVENSTEKLSKHEKRIK